VHYTGCRRVGTSANDMCLKCKLMFDLSEAVEQSDFLEVLEVYDLAGWAMPEKKKHALCQLALA